MSSSSLEASAITTATHDFRGDISPTTEVYPKQIHELGKREMQGIAFRLLKVFAGTTLSSYAQHVDPELNRMMTFLSQESLEQWLSGLAKLPVKAYGASPEGDLSLQTIELCDVI